MKKWTKIDWAAIALLLVGGINWGVIGVADVNIIASLFGKESLLTMIVYTLVGISSIYLALTKKQPVEGSQRLA